jgi:hypothetical protein
MGEATKYLVPLVMSGVVLNSDFDPKTLNKRYSSANTRPSWPVPDRTVICPGYLKSYAMHNCKKSSKVQKGSA